MEQEFERFFSGARLTTNWAARNYQQWATLLAPLREQPLRLVEVGSWEGRSALFFLNFLPNAKIVCIDTFAGSIEHRQWPWWRRWWQLDGIERRFDGNLAPFGARVEKMKADSRTALATLKLADRSFDFIYIDGSHLAADVYSDAVLAWQILAEGGLMVFDDYRRMQGPAHALPSVGIDAFLRSVAGEFDGVFRNFQVAIRKRAA